MFLAGLTTYTFYLGPFLDNLIDFDYYTTVNEGGRVSFNNGFTSSISPQFNSPASGLLSDPEDTQLPIYNKALFCLSSLTNFTNGEFMNYLFAKFLLKLKSKDC